MKKRIIFFIIIFAVLIVFLAKQFGNFSSDFSKGIKEGKGTESIRIQNLSPHNTIASPLIIKGVARGSWFFEATFPVKLVAEDGTLLASGIAKADGDWKTDAFIPFHSQLIFTSIGHTGGIITFERGNNFGNEKNRGFNIPVSFYYP